MDHTITPASNGASGLRLLTAQDAAAMLQVHEATVYRMMQQGEIPCVKFGRSRRIRPQDLDAFIQSNLVTTRA